MKKLFLIIGVLILIVGGVLFFGLSKLGPLIKTAVNKYGPGITQTQVRLGDVDVSLFSAQATIKNFLLGNPKGFETSDAMKVGSILIDLNESTVTKETIVIDRIEVVSPQLTYERLAKTDNFQAILNNVTKGRGTTQSGGDTPKEGSGKKIIIKDFKLLNGKVNLAASLLGQNKSFSTNLPDIHLTGIGEKSGGVYAKEAVQVILAALQKQINSPDVMGLINDKLNELKLEAKALEQKAKEELKKTEEAVKEEAEAKLKEVESDVNKEVESAIKDAESDLTKEVEGALGDLLKK